MIRWRQKSAIILLTATLCMAHLTCATADRLILFNGRDVEGEITAQSSERITVRTANGDVTIPLESVKTIMREGEWQNRLNSATQALARNDVVPALRLVDPAAPDARHLAEVDQLIIRHVERIVQNASTLPSADMILFSRHVRDRPTSAPADLRLALARVLAARDAFADAAAEIRIIPNDFFSSNPMARNHVVAILKDEARRAASVEDAESTYECLQTLLQLMPGAMTTGSRALLDLREAERRLRQNDWEGSLAILCDNVVSVAPALALQLALQIVRSADQNTSGTLLVSIYRTCVDCFSGSAPENELIDLYQRYIRALIVTGHFSECATTADHLGLLDADAGAHALRQCQCAERRAALSTGDFLGHYRLGVWAHEMGLTEEALAGFTIAAEDANLRDNASLQINSIRFEMEQQEFNAITKMYEQRRYGEAIAAAKYFAARHPSSEFAGKARTLIEIAGLEQRRAAKLRPAEAEALLQNAERMLLQERYRDVTDLLNRIEVDYGDTPSAGKARQMRAQVQKQVRRRNATRPHTSTPFPAHPPPDSRTQRLTEIHSIMEGIVDRPLDQ